VSGAAIHPRDRYFEDWAAGEVFESDTHRMDEQRIIDFGREFDPQVFHTDPERARETIYGGLIASGWHTGSVMMRLLTEFLGPASMGSPGGEHLRWLAPVRPGDDLRLRLTVVETVPSSSKPDRGVVKTRSEVVNQHDVVVMSLDGALMMRRRP
jgi:acyl dehydratase